MFEGNGLLIDKQKKKYKKYVSFLFFKIGDWEPLPAISSVALTKVEGSQSMHSARTMGNSVAFKVELYCVYLFIDSKRKILVRKTKNHHEAKILAEGAANYLGVPMSNYVKQS